MPSNPSIGGFSRKRVCSGNGLVSYYINLVLEGVGISNPRSKAAINGGLQVSGIMQCHFRCRVDRASQVWNWVAAMSSSLLVDRVGRRSLFIASNIGMLFGTSLSDPYSYWLLTIV